MIITILNLLQFAKYDLLKSFKTHIGIEFYQATENPETIKKVIDAVTLLEKGYDLHTPVFPLYQKYENLENAPKCKSKIDLMLKFKILSAQINSLSKKDFLSYMSSFYDDVIKNKNIGDLND